jgi:two-component system, NarL family, nitrate/nitrite response regulator NarL
VTAAMRTVVVADDHVPTRAGVRAALEGHGFSVVAEVADAAAAVEATVRERPDVCVLDVHMPGGGIAAAAEIAQRHPDTTVVMLTVSRDDEDLFAALKAGASGYLLKDMAPARLAATLAGVLAGEAALPRTLVARLIREFRATERRPRMRWLERRGVELTERELEVLNGLRQGLSTVAIADRLGVSPVTVRRHVSGILAKLRVPDRPAALRMLEDEDIA